MKISYQEHNIASQGFTKDQVFGLRGGRNDGIHLNGEHGEEAYRNSVLAAMKNCGISRRREGNFSKGL